MHYVQKHSYTDFLHKNQLCNLSIGDIWFCNLQLEYNLQNLWLCTEVWSSIWVYAALKCRKCHSGDWSGVDWIVSNWKWDKKHTDMLFTIIKVKHTRKTQKNHTFNDFLTLLKGSSTDAPCTSARLFIIFF